MKITRTSIYSGITTTASIDATAEQLQAWRDGELIQNAMPNLSPDEREFMISGLTPVDWENIFANDEE